jgi:transposase
MLPFYHIPFVLRRHYLGPVREINGGCIKKRYVVECFSRKIKRFRKIATRYGELEASFITFVFLTAIAILLLL